MRIEQSRKIWMKRSLLYRKYTTGGALLAAFVMLYESKLSVDPHDEEAHLRNRTYVLPFLLKTRWLARTVS